MQLIGCVSVFCILLILEEYCCAQSVYSGDTYDFYDEDDYLLYSRYPQYRPYLSHRIYPTFNQYKYDLNIKYCYDPYNSWPSAPYDEHYLLTYISPDSCRFVTESGWYETTYNMKCYIPDGIMYCLTYDSNFLDKPVPNISSKPLNKPSGNSISKPLDKPSRNSISKPFHKPSENSISKPLDKPSGKTFSKALEKPLPIIKLPGKVLDVLIPHYSTINPSDIMSTEVPFDMATKAPFNLATEAPFDLATEALFDLATEAPFDLASWPPFKGPHFFDSR